MWSSAETHPDLMTDNADMKLVVGTRFNGVAIPPGASITNAYLQFQADESHSVATTLTIRAQAADNPPVHDRELRPLVEADDNGVRQLGRPTLGTGAPGSLSAARTSLASSRRS